MLLFGSFRREQNRFRPSTGTGVRSCVENEIPVLQAMLLQPTQTGHDFHALRKIFSRLVAFYNALLAQRPNAEISRCRAFWQRSTA
jgi:hypothetical protein